MIVRGICCLIPGVKGETENIHNQYCRKISGTFQNLHFRNTGERKRLYFICGLYDKKYCTSRVEVAAPIYDPDIKMQLIRKCSLQC